MDAAIPGRAVIGPAIWQKTHSIFRASLSSYTFVRGPHFGHRTRASLNIALITVMWSICVYQSVLWLNVGLLDVVCFQLEYETIPEKFKEFILKFKKFKSSSFTVSQNSCEN